MLAKSTPPQSSKERKTIFNHYVRTWRGLKQKGQMQICLLEFKAMFNFYKMVVRDSGDFDNRQKCGGAEGGGTKTEVCH